MIIRASRLGCFRRDELLSSQYFTHQTGRFWDVWSCSFHGQCHILKLLVALELVRFLHQLATDVAEGFATTDLHIDDLARRQLDGHLDFSLILLLQLGFLLVCLQPMAIIAMVNWSLLSWVCHLSDTNSSRWAPSRYKWSCNPKKPQVPSKLPIYFRPFI